ncbi:leucine-rich repeat domain-containing protein [Treponema socranskii]|uniref:leucine-rich repeat domain-containing protein n=1 Tax=Treponema socranskii TaxID=53419 RepID=UPI003D8F1ADD
MKHSNTCKKRAHAFSAWALITAAVLALVALFGMTGCPNNAGGGGGGNSGGGGTPVPVYTQVPYGTNGADLQAWLQNTASATDLNYIELTGVPNQALNATYSDRPSPLGKIIKASGKKVALKLPKEVTQIGSWAFNGCTLLESIDLSACIRLTGAGEGYGIENDAFAGCTALKTVIMPTGAPWMKKIRRDAFKGCEVLSSIDLSGFMELTTIEASTFQDCTALKEVRLPKKLTTIGTDAFKNCPIETLVIYCNIENKAGEDTIVKNLTQTASVKEHLKTLRLGEGVTMIGKYAFFKCMGLTQIDLSACTGLAQIGERAFSDCTTLEAADFSACISLRGIDVNAFNGCDALRSADLSRCTLLTEIKDGAFFCCKQAEVKLPESILTIGDGAFGDKDDEETLCKKVLIKSGAEYDRIKGLVTGSGYPEARVGSY